VDGSTDRGGESVNFSHRIKKTLAIRGENPRGKKGSVAKDEGIIFQTARRGKKRQKGAVLYEQVKTRRKQIGLCGRAKKRQLEKNDRG